MDEKYIIMRQKSNAGLTKPYAGNMGTREQTTKKGRSQATSYPKTAQF
jgi:hypothetical protein